MKTIFLIFSLLVPTISFAQSYSIDWYKVAGGGGASTNGVYTLSGALGQPDASGAMTGGNYSLTGGFWSLSLVSAVACALLFRSLLPIALWMMLLLVLAARSAWLTRWKSGIAAQRCAA